MDRKQWAEETMQRILKKMDKTALQIGATFPHISEGKGYDDKLPHWWTNGFWPGMLWMAYELTQDEKYAKTASEIEEKMDVVLDEFDNIDHDAGFIWLPSAGVHYRLDGNDASRRRVLKAASFLASRFHLKGSFIQAWNGEPGYAIIDCTMNLCLLYWASNLLDNSRFSQIAEAHLETVLEHSVRKDNSVNHILSFDPETGDFIEAIGGQGAAPDSAWSRGTSWAVYGLALAYRHLGDQRYLDAAKKVANFFLMNLPEDYVSHWDFRVERTAETPRDTSAAACTACGLLEIADFLPKAEGDVYRDWAYRILRSLTDNYSNLDNDVDPAILREGTSHFPRGAGVNVGLIYGDYFYMEGIYRMMGNSNICWYSEKKMK